jgi:hypothetical protein
LLKRKTLTFIVQNFTIPPKMTVMKKSILLLMAGVIAGSANGQEALHNSMVYRSHHNEQVSASTNFLAGGVNLQPTGTASSAHRTTTGGGRWYSYVDSVFLQNPSVTASDFYSWDIWNDTSSLLYDGTSAYVTNEWVSMGLGLSPWANQWNSTAYFPAGEIAIRNSDPYTIDSVRVFGFFGHSVLTPHKVGVVDTLVIALVQGNGGSTSNMPGYSFTYSGSTSLPALYGLTSNLVFVDMAHDSLHNRAGNWSGTVATTLPASQVFKFPLTILDTITTGTVGAGGTLGKAYPRRVGDPVINFPVTAGNFAAASITFVSGDGPSSPGGLYPPFPAHDTIQYASNVYKYDQYSPIVAFSGARGTGGQVFPPYLASQNDWTSGYFKREGISADNGWGGLYVPNWAWTTSSGTAASALQYPVIDFHVTCSACLLVGNPTLEVHKLINESSISVLPNPASNELNLSYTLTETSSVTASLTNMVGQVVATQNLNNVNGGKITFNTTALPAGMYIFTLQAGNGERSSGRVVVAH